MKTMKLLFIFVEIQGFLASLSIGHILLSVTLTAVCITFQYPIDIISVTNKKSAKISTKVGFLHFNVIVF